MVVPEAVACDKPTLVHFNRTEQSHLTLSDSNQTSTEIALTSPSIYKPHVYLKGLLLLYLHPNRYLDKTESCKRWLQYAR